MRIRTSTEALIKQLNEHVRISHEKNHVPEGFQVDLNGECNDPGESQNISMFEISDALEEPHIRVRTLDEQQKVISPPKKFFSPVSFKAELSLLSVMSKGDKFEPTNDGNYIATFPQDWLGQHAASSVVLPNA